MNLERCSLWSGWGGRSGTGRILQATLLLVLLTLVLGSFATAAEPELKAAPEPAEVEQTGQPPAATGAAAKATPGVWFIAPVGALLALTFAIFFYKSMMKSSEGTDMMRQIAAHVREGAYAYLKRQYRVVAIVFVVLAIILAVLAVLGIQNPFVPVAFLTGGFFSGLCGYLGMRTATNASARTAQGCSESLNKGLQVAFRSGAVMGLVVVGFGLLDISIWYLVLNYIYDNNVFGLSAKAVEKVGLSWTPEVAGSAAFTRLKLVEITTTMVTFGMGASTQALFARVGGGIYTKAADVGADLVGKVEAGIPEDDPRNPATIADNVGDNVGDVAGMGADLYESYYASILATAALGAALPVAAGVLNAAGLVKAVTAPMIVAGIGILLSIAGVFLVRTKEGATQKSLLRALLLGTLGSSALIVATLVLLRLGGVIEQWGIVGSVVAGLLAGVIIGQATEYYTSDAYSPTQTIAEQAQMGPATTIIHGLSVGMYSTAIPVVTICVVILVAFGLAGGFGDMSSGLYGVGFAAVGMLSTLGITLATDAYGPIADNAGGNAEMSGLDPSVRERTDILDSLGNTTAATGKGFAIGSAALTALALLATYIGQVRVWISRMAADAGGVYETLSGVKFTNNPEPDPGQINIARAEIGDFVAAFDLSIMNPMLLCGLFIGSMMAFVFCAMTMQAVGRAAGLMVEEVRRQFKKLRARLVADGMSDAEAADPDNWPATVEAEGEEIPNYAHCVAISTAGAQREMLVPSILAIVVPVLGGVILGVAGVLGILAGGLVTGFALACMLNNAGGAWDNAKKYIEKGAHGGKKLADGSKNPVHGAAVVGDTVGDPCKDTSGPSLNILIKLMSIVSVVFSGLVVTQSPKVQGLLMKLLGILD